MPCSRFIPRWHSALSRRADAAPRSRPAARGPRARSERREYDPVSGVLIDRAFEAVHAVGQNLEEAVEDLVPLFGIELLGQIHRPLHVGEEHGDLLALAFEGAAGGENLLGEVLGGIGARLQVVGGEVRRVQ